MSAQMGQNCPTKAFFVAWSKLCFKYYVLWPVCHTYSTSQCLWMTWQWNSWNSHYIVFCSIVPISVSRISMLCHYIVGHCKNMRSKPILSLYWSFSKIPYLWLTTVSPIPLPHASVLSGAPQEPWLPMRGTCWRCIPRQHHPILNKIRFIIGNS